MALENHYGAELKAEINQILKFLDWAKGAPNHDIQKISQDSSYVHGLIDGMIGLRKGKCACPNKTGCVQPNHTVDNHFASHCLFDTFQGDSNHFNSFLIAMSARKLPVDITSTAVEQRRKDVKSKEQFTAEDFCQIVNSAVQNH